MAFSKLYLAHDPTYSFKSTNLHLEVHCIMKFSADMHPNSIKIVQSRPSQQPKNAIFFEKNNGGEHLRPKALNG